MVAPPSSFSTSKCVAGKGSLPSGVKIGHIAAYPEVIAEASLLRSGGQGAGLRGPTLLAPDVTLRQGSSAVKPALEGDAPEYQLAILADDHVGPEERLGEFAVYAD